MRLITAVSACGLSALACACFWISSRQDVRQVSAGREHVSETKIESPSAPATSLRRIPSSMNPRPAQYAVQSTSTDVLSRLSVLSLGTLVDSVAIGDVTGDGRNDVVASTFYDEYGAPTPNDFKVFVLIQQADGNLAPPLQVSFPGYERDRRNPSIAIVDLNNDGLREIVLGKGNGSSPGIFIVEGAATGNLVGRSVANATRPVSTLVALDVNRDGNMDIATYDYFNIVVYLGDGRGGLQLGSTVSTWPVEGTGSSSHMVSGDFDSDGRVDLAIHDHDFATVFRQDNSGNFVQWYRAIFPYPASAFTAIAAADFDSDGDHDLMLTTSGAERNRLQAKFALYRQSGGLFETDVRWADYYYASAMIGADIDLDGRQDILTVRTVLDRTATLGYSRQLPDGSFDVEIEFPLTGQIYLTSPRGLAAGDFTGDGCNDVAVTSIFSLVLFRGKCSPPRVMAGPLPPRLLVSPAAAPSGAVSAQTVRPIDNPVVTRDARRPRSLHSATRQRVRQSDR